MNTHCTTAGIDLNNVLTRIDQADLQIRALETVLAEKRSQLHSDIEMLDTHTEVAPEISAGG